MDLRFTFYVLRPPSLVSFLTQKSIIGLVKNPSIFTSEPRLEALYFRAQIGLLDPKAGEIHPLGIAFQSPSNLRVSPDSRALSLVAAPPDTPFGRYAWMVDPETLQTTCLTPDLAATVEGLAWLPHGDGLLFLVSEGTQSRFYLVTPDGPDQLQPVDLALPASIDAWDLPPEGPTFLAVAQDFRQGPELWSADPVSGETTKLTAENASVGKLKLGSSRMIRWPSTEELEIEGILTLPPNFKQGPPSPTILVVHGGPAGRFRQDLGPLPRQLLANEGYVVLMPNPRGSTGYHPDFVRANFQDWGGGDFRDLMAGLDALIEQGLADPERLGIYGGSYGGYMTAWTVTQTDRFRAAVCQCGLTNLYSFYGQTDITPSFLKLYFGEVPYENPELYRARSAMTHLHNVQTPTLFLHGEQDVRVPIAQSYEMYWGLRYRGLDTEFVIYPREGHAITETPHQRDLYGRILEWFGKYLK